MRLKQVQVFHDWNCKCAPDSSSEELGACMPDINADAFPVAKSRTTILYRALSAVFCMRTWREVTVTCFSFGKLSAFSFHEATALLKAQLPWIRPRNWQECLHDLLTPEIHKIIWFLLKKNMVHISNCVWRIIFTCVPFVLVNRNNPSWTQHPIYLPACSLTSAKRGTKTHITQERFLLKEWPLIILEYPSASPGQLTARPSNYHSHHASMHHEEHQTLPMSWQKAVSKGIFLTFSFKFLKKSSKPHNRAKTHHCHVCFVKKMSRLCSTRCSAWRPVVHKKLQRDQATEQLVIITARWWQL